jgi:hypothetical protein
MSDPRQRCAADTGRFLGLLVNRGERCLGLGRGRSACEVADATDFFQMRGYGSGPGALTRFFRFSQEVEPMTDGR